MPVSRRDVDNDYGVSRIADAVDSERSRRGLLRSAARDTRDQCGARDRTDDQSRDVSRSFHSSLPEQRRVRQTEATVASANTACQQKDSCQWHSLLSLQQLRRNRRPFFLTALGSKPQNRRTRGHFSESSPFGSDDGHRDQFGREKTDRSYRRGPLRDCMGTPAETERVRL